MVDFDNVWVATSNTVQGVAVSLQTTMVKRVLLLVTLVCLHPSTVSGQQLPAAQRLSFYVSPSGSDRNPGTAALPFATLAAAQSAVRVAKAKQPSRAPITVWLHGGLYLMDASFRLTKDDSGEPGFPVIYRAVPGQTPRLFGGSRLDPATFSAADISSQPSLDPKAAPYLLKAPLPAAAAHIVRYPDVFRGNGGLFQLLFDDRRMPLSRWPKNGYTTMASVLDSGIAPPAGGTFTYRPEVEPHAQQWARAARNQTLWLTGFWRVPFQVDSIRVAAIDTARHTITLAAPAPGGIGSKYVETVNGTRHGNGKEPYYAFNLPEEISQPGEWSYDFNARQLFFWPPVQNNLSAHELLIANLTQPVIILDGASDIRLEGLTVEGGLHEGIQVRDGNRIVVAGCTLRNIGGGGIDIEGGFDNIVQSNDLTHLGSYGIRLVAGERKTLTPGRALADNNHISQIGEQDRITEGIFVGGVGNRVTHNLIHDAPYHGIRYAGNDQLMAYNEVHHVGLDAGDLGIFYTNGDWAAQGNRIEFNFGHDSPNANGSYIDDGASGRATVNNIFYKLASGIFLGGGHDNLVAGNLFLECRTAIHIDNRGVARHYDASAHHLTDALKTIDASSPPWSARYPNFLTGILANPTQPTGNIVRGNAVLDAAKPFEVSSPATVDPTQNPILANETHVAGPSALDLLLRPDSALFKLIPGFKPIPVHDIGLYLDHYRSALPTAEETGRFTDRIQIQHFDSNQDVKASDRIGAAKP